ncbi:GNAT family N-acetyltransferase [Clostridium intestinale]|uniref:GNAT family N-acetyltransferase n=1 Tax=Clostridium intestinale TaxID=36845 RepID=UPI002DD62BF6|nr:GNAT family N-acetyltransferase [Clostridium intestinale]WRY51971.1 GNAT family N-acetyltransferase [Clostridium intestinale]
MEKKFNIMDHYDEQEFLNNVRINGLLKYNMDKTKGKLKDPNVEIMKVARNENGIIIGGIAGSTYLSSLEIEVLWVSEAYRGQSIASQLLNEIENEAKKAGCLLAHLTTYSFQAPYFYQKNGYVVCGEIEGFPDNIKLHILKKLL